MTALYLSLLEIFVVRILVVTRNIISQLNIFLADFAFFDKTAVKYSPNISFSYEKLHDVVSAMSRQTQLTER